MCYSFLRLKINNFEFDKEIRILNLLQQVIYTFCTLRSNGGAGYTQEPSKTFKEIREKDEE